MYQSEPHRLTIASQSIKPLLRGCNAIRVSAISLCLLAYWWWLNLVNDVNLLNHLARLDYVNQLNLLDEVDRLNRVSMLNRVNQLNSVSCNARVLQPSSRAQLQLGSVCVVVICAPKLTGSCCTVG